jgi:hypothetical protein
MAESEDGEAINIMKRELFLGAPRTSMAFHMKSQHALGLVNQDTWHSHCATITIECDPVKESGAAPFFSIDACSLSQFLVPHTTKLQHFLLFLLSVFFYQASVRCRLLTMWKF